MAWVNTFQEEIELEALKPKIKQAIQEQKKREKNGKFIRVKDAPGNLYILKINK